MKLLRNLDGVRKNRPLAKSEIGSTMASLKSRASNFSARSSAVAAGRAGPLVSSLHDGRLSKIDETTGEAGKAGFCEACPNKDKEISEDDMTVNEDISKSVIED